MMLDVSYFIIVPELGTDSVVAALRGSWLRPLPHSRVHYCVANNTASDDPLLHRLPVHRRRNTPLAREAFFAGGRLINPAARERYNGFLRRKVFAMLQSMSELAAKRELDYAVLLDADTVMNVSNLMRFVGALPGGGDASIYTGRCLQYPLDDRPDGSSSGGGSGGSGGGGGGDDGGNGNRRRELPIAAPTTPLAGLKRYDVDWYIAMSRQTTGARAHYPPTIPPSPGGGPGLIFSRALLTSVRGNLPSCAPLAGWMAMGDTIFSGGDSMLTRCLAGLGVRCSNQRDLQLDRPERCPFAHGCDLTSLFRKNPPWFYLAATRHQKRVRRQGTITNVAQRTALADALYGLDAPLDETIAFHHVKPSNRVHGFDADSRCAVRMRSDPAGRAGWWASACLPHFALLGAPHAGTEMLANAIFLHPEVVAPPFEGLDFFRMPGRVQTLLGAVYEVDRGHGAARRVGHSTMSTGPWRALLRLYANHFPSIDPRDFRLTGEASPQYLYSAAAPAFFSLEHLRMSRLVVILRNPAERALAELSSLARRWSVGLSDLGAQMLRATEGVLLKAHSIFRGCGMHYLYAAQGSPSTNTSFAGPPHTGAKASKWSAALCYREASDLKAANSDAWKALWRSWYHLFLGRWLPLSNGNRPMILFWEDLRQQPTSTLGQLATFLRLHPAALEPAQLVNGDKTQPAFAPSRMDLNLSRQSQQIMHILVADAAACTDAILRAAGEGGVPAGWLLSEQRISQRQCW